MKKIALEELAEKIRKGDISSREELEKIASSFEEDSDIIGRYIFSLYLNDKDVTKSEVLSKESSSMDLIQRIMWSQNPPRESELISELESLFGVLEALFLLDKFDLEDFRPIARFCYLFLPGQTIVERIVLILLKKAQKDDTPHDSILETVRDSLDFLNMPVITPERIVMLAEQLSLKIHQKSSFETIDLLGERPEYVEEILGSRKYSELEREETFSWLSHETCEKIKDLYVTRALTQAQTLLKDRSDKISMSEGRKLVQELLEKEGFSSFPLTFKLLKELKDSFILPPVDMNSLKNVPKKIINDFLPKKCFSSPSLHQKDIEIIFLGGTSIGRSGILLKTNNGALLLDFGMSVVNNNIPFWTRELSSVDGVLITHSHLDHVGGLPFLYGSEILEEPWYGVSPTDKLASILLWDNMRILKSRLSPKILDRDPILSKLHQEMNVIKTLENFIPLSPGKPYEISPGVMVTALPAAHIFGSVGYLLELDGTQVLYTGDMNLASTQLFEGAVFPKDCDLTIVDGTYFGQPSFDLEKESSRLVQEVLESRRIIIPAFSLGRAQEVLQTLLNNPQVCKEKNLVLVGMAAKIAKLANVEGNYTIMGKGFTFDEGDVVISGGGMLQGGFARALLESTKNDPKTTVILCGYLAKGTMGYSLREGNVDGFDQRVVYCRLSGHSPAPNLHTFLEELQGQKIVVHCGKFSGKLETLGRRLVQKDNGFGDLIFPWKGQRLRIRS